MSNFLRNLNATTVLAAQKSSLMASMEAAREMGEDFRNLRSVARVTRDFGASRPVMEVTGVLEHLSGAGELPSLESLDVIPARRSDERTVLSVETFSKTIATESAMVGDWLNKSSSELSLFLELATEALSETAAAADTLVAAIEGHIVEEPSLAMSNFIGNSSDGARRALESIAEIATNIGPFSAEKLGTVDYQKECQAGFEALCETDGAKASGLKMDGSTLRALSVEADFAPVNGSLESAGYNIPEAVASLSAGAAACRALETLLADRYALGSCLSDAVSHLPAAEGIDGLAEGATESLSGARDLASNYVTALTSLVGTTLSNTLSALAAGEALKDLV